MDSSKKRDGCGIILAYQCNSHCAHCLYACGPKRSSAMERSTMRLVASWISHTVWASTEVHIGGGEPFLFEDALLQLCGELRSASIEVAFIETNGFWGHSPDRYLPTLAALQNVGVQRISIGMSPFHARYVPVNDALHAAEVAKRIFGKEGCTIEHPWFSEPHLCGNAISESFEECDLLLSNVVKWDSYLRTKYELTTGGRVGYGKCIDFLLKESAEKFRVPCNLELRPPCHCHIDPFGTFLPDVCAGIALGNLHTKGSTFPNNDSEIVDRLVRGGPALLAEWAAEQHKFSQKGEGYVGKCHLCVDVRFHLWSLGLFRSELGPDEFYEEIQRHD